MDGRKEGKINGHSIHLPLPNKSYHWKEKGSNGKISFVWPRCCRHIYRPRICSPLALEICCAKIAQKCAFPAIQFLHIFFCSFAFVYPQSFSGASYALYMFRHAQNHWTNSGFHPFKNWFEPPKHLNCFARTVHGGQKQSFGMENHTKIDFRMFHRLVAPKFLIFSVH